MSKIIKIIKINSNSTSRVAYKFRFYPQKDLMILLAKTFGCSRFVYNQTLKFSEEHYKSKFLDIDKTIINPNYKSLSSIDRINYIKTLKNNPEYLWLKEVSSIALQQSVMHLNTAYDRFFNGIGGYPQFKKKINKNSFTITGKNSLHFDEHFLKNKQFYLPKYAKPLNIRFSRNFNHLAVSSVTISQEPSGKYYISFLVEENISVNPVKNQGNNINQKTSYDLGLKTTAKVYDGNNFYDFNLPELIKAVDKKLRKAQRIMSRRQKGSKNRNKQRIKIARLHEKKNNILTDNYHKLSTKIINENQVIVRESLAVKNMIKNRKLSRAIHAVAWSKFNNMITYKAQWHNRETIEVDRFYPSSKECNCCKHINHGLKLSDRTWTCVACNAVHDRDENACLNLHNYKKTTAGTAANACGGNVRPKSSKNIISKKTKAVSNETGI
jgi:putative transposase